MKKLLLISAGLILIAGLALRGYYAFVPPPEPTLHKSLLEIVPEEIDGWSVKDYDMAESPESAARVSDLLKFDDALFRVFRRGDTFVGLYIAYWTPGKVSYRWAGSHTPDTCWIANGWTRLDRKHSIPLPCDNYEFKPAEFGVYKKGRDTQNVYFWHLLGGVPFGYSEKMTPTRPIYGSLLDIKTHGLKLREEQFFIRLSSNKNWEELEDTPGFDQIKAALDAIGLTYDHNRN